MNSWENLPNKEKYKEFVDFVKCQIGLVVEAYKYGRSIEFESFSPYIADYDLHTGRIRNDILTNEDKIGLAVAKVLHKYFSEARMVSLYDEYNTGLPDSQYPTGRPLAVGPQIQLSETVKENFKKEVERLLRENGLIDAKNNYLLISETEKTSEAEELVRRLEIKGCIEKKGEAIYFVPKNPENKKFKKIILRTSGGRWLCEALDASTYLKPENLEITHLVVLSKDFIEQQDKVWEILRELDIRPTHYHNIFYDKNFDPAITAEIVEEEIKKAFASYES